MSDEGWTLVKRLRSDLFGGGALELDAADAIEALEARCREQSASNIDFLQRWMRTPNPMLGGAVPLDMMYQGMGRRVAQFIDSAFTAETSCEHHWMPATQDGSLAILGRGCSKCGAWETKVDEAG